MKKTLLAAVIAASFGFTAAHADTSLPAYNADGNPVSVVLAGSLDLQVLGNYVGKTFDAPTSVDGKKVLDINAKDHESNLGYNLNGADLALTVSAPFMGTFSAFTTAKAGFGIAEDKFELSPKLLILGVSSDDFGTLTIGYQNSASDDLAYNGFSDYDIASPTGSASGAVSGFSTKYTSPEFNGVTAEVSLGFSNNSQYSKKTMTGPDGKPVVDPDPKHKADNAGQDQSSFDVSNLSLGVQYQLDGLTVATTVDLAKHFATDNLKTPSDQSTRGQVGFTLGAGYDFGGYSVFGNFGYVNNVDWSSLDAAFAVSGDEATFIHNLIPADGVVYQLGGQLGGSYNFSDSDNVTAAVQFGMFGTNAKKDKGQLDKAYLVGFKAAVSHQFNDSFSVYAFTAYNHTSAKTETKDTVKKAEVTGSTEFTVNQVNYGLGLKYEF